MVKNKIFALFILLLPLCCLSQTNGRVPLTVILEQITKIHHTKFSYIDNDISPYTLTAPAQALSLAEYFDYIEHRTKLKFEQRGVNNYFIKNQVTAQNPLCGYLVNAKTGAPVEDAVITYQDKSIIVSSDVSGYFSMPSAAGMVYISHVNFKPKVFNAFELYVPGCPVFYLDEIPTQLQEVVAQRYLANGISKKEGGQLVVKPQKFGILPGLTDPDVLQTMQQLPGVTSVDETVSNINVRGGTHDQNLFLWNGIRMFQTSHFFGLISAFNPLPATTISIYKNGSPAFYGESVSSLIDISTHAQPRDSVYTVFAADMLTVNALSAMQLSKKDRLQVSARRSITDFITTPAFKSYRQRIFQNTTITDVLENQNVPVKSNDTFYFYDVSLSYHHTFGSHHSLLIDGIGIENSLSVFQSTPSAQRTDNLLQKSLGGSATLLSEWNSKSTSEIQAYLSVYDVNATNASIEDEQVTNQKNTIRDKGLRLKYNYILSPDVTISTGYQFNEISVRNFDAINIPAFSKNEKVVSRSHAVVAQGAYTSKNTLTRFDAGLRLNYFEKYGTLLAEPRLVFSQKIREGLKLEISAEQKSQTVSQVIDLQQDFLGIEKRRWVLADEKAIPIQKSLQASAGLNYANNGWYASIEGFYKKISGITSNSQGFQNQFEFLKSTGYYRVLGCELLLQKRLGNFYSWLSYSYNDNHYRFINYVPPAFSNNFAIPHAVTAAGSYEWHNLRIALGAKWRSGTPVTEPLSFNIDPDNPANSKVVYGNPNNGRLNDNVQVNFSLSKTWNLNKHTVFTGSCSVLNILNSKNIINRYYRINKSNNNIESIDSYGLKRTPNLSVKVIF